MASAEWVLYPNFSKEEFDCKETGENQMQHEFMELLQQLRIEYGKPIIISSGFRSPLHSIEIKKQSPGSHTTGLAADLAVNRKDAYKVLSIAFKLGFTGIGVNQKGNSRFVHLDIASDGFARPNVWSY